jgi:hypothetical protein
VSGGYRVVHPPVVKAVPLTTESDAFASGIGWLTLLQLGALATRARALGRRAAFDIKTRT